MAKTRTYIKLRPIRVEHVDEIPDDVRAELDHEELLLSGRGVAHATALLVPENVLAEQDAAERAVVEEPGDDAARLAPTAEEDTHQK